MGTGLPTKVGGYGNSHPTSVPGGPSFAPETALARDYGLTVDLLDEVLKVADIAA
jgi:hypothetical protein